MFGRVEEREWLERTLAARPGCVQVVGPPGIGKSTLVEAVVAPELPWFSLEPVTPGELLSFVAGELGCMAKPAAVQASLEAAGGCVLDGAESHGAELLPLLRGWRDLGIVVTSRLRMGSFPALEVGPLDHESAVELFLARGKDAGNFSLERTEAVEQLVKRLDRWPLAIELAASRLRLYAPAEMLEEDMLEILTDRHRPGRHGSVEGALDGSWRLLDPTDREALARLSLLRRPFGRTVFKSVTGQGIDTLERLMDASLVVWQTVEGRRRYRLLHPVRAFAQRHLPADDEAHGRYRSMVLDRAQHAEGGIHGPGGRDSYDVLRLLSDDLRSIVDMGTPDQAATAAHALAVLAQVQGGLDRAARRLELVLERDLSAYNRQKIQRRLADVLIDQMRYDEATAIAEQLPDSASKERLLGRGRMRVRGDVVRAIEHFQRAVELAEPELDPLTATLSRASLGVANRRRGDNFAAMAAYDQALDLARRYKLIGAEAAILANRTLIQIDWHGVDAAMIATLEHAATLALDQGHHRRYAQVAVLLARSAVETGDPAAPEAIEHAREASRKVGDQGRLEMLDAIEAFAHLEAGRLSQAEALIPADDTSDAHHRIAQSYSLRGYLHWARGEHTDAQRAFELARESWDLARLGREVLMTTMSLAALAGAEVPSLDPRDWPDYSPMWIARQTAKHLREGRVPPPDLLAAAKVSIECRLLTALGCKQHEVLVAADGTWFRTDGGRVDLKRRRVLTRVLAALARRPHERVQLETLIDEGWPGERLTHDSGRSRVHVAVADLRRMGLRSALETIEGAYVLKAKVAQTA